LVVALAILGAGALFTSVDLGDNLGAADSSGLKQETTLLLASPGEIGDTRSNTRVSRIGSFSVGQTRGEVQAVNENQVTLSDTVLGGESADYTYDASEPRGGIISFNVEGRQGVGKVTVSVNGKDLWSKALVQGGSPEIQIPEAALGPGKNTVKFQAESPGILDATEYRIEDLSVNIKDRKLHSREENFKLYGFELRNYIEGELTFTITESVPSTPLDISVNGNEIYSFSQIPVTESVNITPADSGITPGSNTITFSTSRPSEYQIQNAQIAVRYLSASSKAERSFDFTATKSQQEFADKDSTKETVEFDYLPLTGQTPPLELSVNNLSKTVEPETGSNTVELPETSYDASNTLTVTSQSPFKTTNLRLKSSEQQE
jgi:hypothetical protein